RLPLRPRAGRAGGGETVAAATGGFGATPPPRAPPGWDEATAGEARPRPRRRTLARWKSGRPAFAGAHGPAPAGARRGIDAPAGRQPAGAAARSTAWPAPPGPNPRGRAACR